MSRFKKYTTLACIVLLSVVAYTLYSSKHAYDVRTEGLIIHDFTLEDTEGGLSLDGRLWQIAPSEVGTLPSYKGLILLSHGFGSNFRSLQTYAIRLAGEGYTVAALTHPDLKGLRSSSVQNDPLIARARHLDLLYTHIKEIAGFNVYEGTPVGILGFSIGGYAALTATGAPISLSNLETVCSEAPQDHELLCNEIFQKRIENIQNADITLSGSLIPASATVLLAPAYTELLDNNVFAHYSTPLFVSIGESDEELNVLYVQETFEDHGAVESFTSIEDAGHFAFLDTCGRITGVILGICKDPHPIDRSHIQEILLSDMISFFDAHLTPKQ